MRKAILASVIASIVFVAFIQPILGFVWKFILSSVNAFSDLTYRHAALGLREENGFILLLGFSGFFFGIVAGYTTSTFFPDSALGAPSPQAPVRNSLPNRLRSFARSKLAAAIILLAVLAGTTLPLAVRFRDMQLNASFQQRLAVLAPHISDQQYKELVASWASMQKEADYEAVVSKMDALASTSNIRLPSPISGTTIMMW